MADRLSRIGLTLVLDPNSARASRTTGAHQDMAFFTNKKPRADSQQDLLLSVNLVTCIGRFDSDDRPLILLIHIEEPPL